jgi:hypothetical protein
MHAKPTIASWQREEEDGSYQADIDGWVLHVSWQPEPSGGGDYGFSWKISDPKGETTASSTELIEEIEIAMARAEEAMHAAASPKTESN